MGIYPNVWADPNAPDFITTPHLEITYGVAVYSLGFPVIIAAWDISVTLDGGRSPYGRAQFKCGITGDWVDMLTPLGPYSVIVDAGYLYAGSVAGTPSVNSHTLFAGIVTSRKLRNGPNGEAYLEITAESYESMLEYPSHLAVAVKNAYTTAKQFYDANAFYIKPAWIEPVTNTAPTAPQLAEYRALSIEKDDDVGDFMRTCASTLGQWVRGQLSDGLGAKRVECITDPYPYDRLNTIPASSFEQLDRDDNLDGWANIVRVTAQWTNASGDKVSKRRTYAVASIATEPVVRAADVTINQKPPSGAVPPSNWGPALRWLRRYNASRGNWSGTMRALWWIQPRIDAIQLSNGPYPSGAGAVQTVTYLVDQGLMNLTWNVT